MVLELATVFVAGGAMVVGGRWALQELGGTRTASAAERTEPMAAPMLPAPAPVLPAVAPVLPAAAPVLPAAASELAEQPAPSPVEQPAPSPAAAETTESTPAGWAFHGVSDADLLGPLRAATTVTEVRFNRGGSSVSLRVDFANGARGSFKPEQLDPQTTPRKEIAAYRLDRLLHLGCVPPSIPMVLERDDIMKKLEKDSLVLRGRIKREVTWKKGQALGEIAWWIPVILPARFRGERLDHDAGALLWWKALSVRSRVTEAEKAMLGQISNMILFDFLTNNTDRFSGGNALMSEDRKLLYYMDNALSFMPDRDGHDKLQRFLGRVQRVSRKMIEEIRGLTREDVVAEMGRDTGALGQLLTAREVDALFSRRNHLLRYVEKLVDKYGEAEVYYFE